MQPQADVIILTALKEEYDAILQVSTGARPGSRWETEPGPGGRTVAFRSFEGSQGSELRVAALWAPAMGTAAAVGAVAPLVEAYKPQCLAMCGVCAGRRGEVELGDVIIGEVLFAYDQGKVERTRTAGRKTGRFLPRSLSYVLRSPLKQRAEAPFSPPDAGPWLALRPRTYEDQMDWFLEQLLHGENPATHPQRLERCAQYEQVLRRLREKQWLSQRGQRLTHRGEQHIRERLSIHLERLPEPKPFRVRMGPLATVTQVQRGPGIFEKLVEKDYKVLGLEMEAAGLAAFSHELDIHCLVMKGVSDFADATKDDLFKPFAARASAECLVAFLRETLAAPAAIVIPEAALATYKQALVEQPTYRYLELQGLANIEHGSRQVKLDLLDFAVAPSLHDGADAASARELELQEQLAREVEDASQRLLLTRERERLLDERWAYYAVRGNNRVEPSSFARVLSRHDRLVIVGDPGAGKSILLRLALLACAEGAQGEKARRLLAEDDPFHPQAHTAIEQLRTLLPVHLKLGKLGEALKQERGLSLEKFIRRQLGQQREGEELLASLPLLLKRGRIFLLCDGLDEVAEELRERVVQEVTALLEQYQGLRLLLTTRPFGYRPRVPHLEHARLASLSPWQQQKLVSRLHLLVETGQRAEAAGVARARLRTQALLRSVQRRPEWQTLSSNPLLLTLSALTRTDHDAVPRHRVIVYNNFVTTLLTEWRSVVPSQKAHQLMEAWASIASALVRQERHLGVPRAHLLGMLADTQKTSPKAARRFAETALRLALERGLVREEEETVSFWHRTFAEFLAAYALTGPQERGAARRILDAGPLPLVVLQFAAARLDYVFHARSELDALARGLLAQDGRGAGRLFRPGLRQVSACLADRVSFSQKTLERVWTSWAELLATATPSPAWKQFAPLAQAATPDTLPATLVEAFTRLPDRGLHEVRNGSSLLVARLATVAPVSTHEACTRWMKTESSYLETWKRHGALGLATLGEWTHEIIDALGQFRDIKEEGVSTIAQLIQRGGPALRQLLLTLAQVRLPQDAPSEERPGPATVNAPESRENERVMELRLSAACLLAVSGTWEESVAWVLRRVLSGQHGSSRLDAIKAVLQHCATEAPVQESLLEWLGDNSTLGHHAYEIVREIAALIEDMPQRVLERATQTEGQVQQRLEELIIQVGTERRSLLDLLWRWLESPPEERRVRAARLLRRLARSEPRLHEALRRGMQTSEPLWRVRWAYESFHLTPELSKLALATLQDCARSAEATVLAAVYDENRARQLLWEENKPTADGWIACAADPAVPAVARLKAAQLVKYMPGQLERVIPIFHELLDSEDAAVRHSAAIELLWRATPDARVVRMAAEGAARATDLQSLLQGQKGLEAFAAEAVQAILRGLPRAHVPEKPENAWMLSRWGILLSELASKNLSCVPALLCALGESGLAGRSAEDALRQLTRDHAAVRDALDERLRQTAEGLHPLELRRLIRLGLSLEAPRPQAIRASRELDPRCMSQLAATQIAELLVSAHAKEDALRFLRSALEGPEPMYVLQAAAELAHAFQAEAGPWVQEALTRLLDAPEPSLRLAAARLALICGVHEERALQEVIRCLKQHEHLHESDWRFLNQLDSLELDAFHGSTEHKVLAPFGARARIDLLAMRTLRLHRPAQGVTWLERWLGDEKLQRFTYAVNSLAAGGHSREAVAAALLERVRTAPDKQLERLVELAHQQSVPRSEVLERLLVRVESEHEPDSAHRGLHSWLQHHPDLWAELRRLPPKRLWKLRFLFFNSPVVTQDTVACAVDAILTEPDYWSQRNLAQTIAGWCQPREGDDPKPSPHDVRGWLQEHLLKKALPRTLEGMWHFDRLAELAKLSPEPRLQVLTSALAIELAPTEKDVEWFLGLQADCAIRMLMLGGKHDRLIPILQRAVRGLLRSWYFGISAFANALLTSWPDDEALRQFVLHTVIVEDTLLSGDELLKLLEHARLPAEERITVLCLCLGLRPREAPPAYAPSASPAWRERASSLFAALEKLGCGRERLAALLHEFVSAHGPELPVATQLALLKRTELTAASAAKLLVGVLTEMHYDEVPPEQQWRARFASKRRASGERERWEPHLSPSSLSAHLYWLAEFSQADEPEPVEQALCELTNVDLSLYRQARQRNALVDAQWSQLLKQLALAPDEPKTSQFAKEWLLMSLWRTWESPAAV